MTLQNPAFMASRILKEGFGTTITLGLAATDDKNGAQSVNNNKKAETKPTKTALFDIHSFVDTPFKSFM